MWHIVMQIEYKHGGSKLERTECGDYPGVSEIEYWERYFIDPYNFPDVSRCTVINVFETRT